MAWKRKTIVVDEEAQVVPFSANLSFLEIQPTNFLSFGPGTPSIPLKQLNVLIGPNGSGKSNLLEAISLLRATPVDTRPVINRDGGGTADWIWKGSKGKPASVEVIISNPSGPQPLRHRLEFSERQHAFQLIDERIEYLRPDEGHEVPYSFYQFRNGRPLIKSRIADPDRELSPQQLDRDRSILAQLKDPEAYPVFRHLAETYDEVRMFREWTFGRNAIFRQAQKLGGRNDRLEENFENLGPFLNYMKMDYAAKQEMLELLRSFYEGFDDYEVLYVNATSEVFFQEGGFNIPATRLSDGTVRYLCLLAILCDPKPPRLICIEEPELGLHPDVIPSLAKLLLSASERTQLVVTTHSDILIDALTDHPEYVLICEKHEGQTQMIRLDKNELAIWLEKYSLGNLWRSGQIGGNRW